MHQRQHDPNHHKDSDKADDLVFDRRSGKQQPLGEECAGQHQRHKEDDALDHVVLGRFDIGIGARLQPKGRAGMAHKISPALVGIGFRSQI